MAQNVLPHVKKASSDILIFILTKNFYQLAYKFTISFYSRLEMSIIECIKSLKNKYKEIYF